MSQPGSDAARPASDGASSDRSFLTRYVVKISILATIVLGVAVIAASALDASKERTALESAKWVLGVVLPLLGTWVGTILAFYFGKDNFEAATRQTLAAVREVLPSSGPDDLSVDQVGESMDAVTKLALEKDAAGIVTESESLADIEKLLTGKVSRLPLVDDKGVVRFMLHRSTYDKFKNEAKIGGGDVDPAQHTLKDMLDSASPDPDYKTMRDFLGRTFGIVSAKETVGGVKKVMRAARKINDVFVTQGGKPDERALRWITNSHLARFEA
jgi:hypothetical protein